jgi:hypothetical protein
MLKRIIFIILLVAMSASVSTAQPWIRITAPNGGENWIMGSIHSIRWTDSLTGSLRIDLYRAAFLVSTLNNSAPNTGSYAWTISSSLEEGTDYKIKITSLNFPSAFDWSDNDFTLTRPPTLHITSPVGYESYCIGDTVPLTWTSLHMEEDNIHIVMKRFFPTGNWTVIANATENDGYYAWVCTGPPSIALRISMQGTVHTAALDTTDAPITVADSLTAPIVTIHKDPEAIRLRWTPVGCASYYQIWSSTLSNGEYSLFATTSDITYTLEPDTASRIFFYVKAGN